MSRHRATGPRHGRVGASMARIGALAAGGLVLAVAVTGVSVTAAAFRDRAHLTTSVGSSTPFALVLVDAEGLTRPAPVDAPLVVPVDGADALVPGRTVSVPLTVANNHPDIAAAIGLTLTAERVDQTPDLTPELRYSVLAADGTPLVGGDDPADGLPVGQRSELGGLAARGAPAAGPDTPWTGGAEGSTITVVLRLHLLDGPQTEALNGGQVAVSVTVDGTSVAS